MALIAKSANAEDLLLRPLSAQLLAPTLPEREGWVNREYLLKINGRGRKYQIKLARQFGFQQFAQPAGGCCFLTNPQYANKLKDLLSHRHRRDYGLDEIILLKFGRHLRPAPYFKLIVSRREAEGRFLASYRQRFIHLTTTSHPGPEALIDGKVTDSDLLTAASIVAGYSQGRSAAGVNVVVSPLQALPLNLKVVPFNVAKIPGEWRL